MGTATAQLRAERQLGGVRLRLIEGDLTALAADAVVFYAKENLDLGSGFGTAIQSRGGGAIKKELEKIGGVRMGEAVITSAGAMNARHIIHACGPKFQEPEREPKLRACMLSALRLANEHGLTSIAFPPMGAGFYGVPLDLCARVMLDAIRKFCSAVSEPRASASGNEPSGRADSALKEIIICVIDKREFTAFENLLGGI